jgi:hypothetical protein
MTRFYQQVYAAMIRHFDLDQLKAVIIASPGFTREAILQFVMEEAQVLVIHAMAFCFTLGPADKQQERPDSEVEVRASSLGITPCPLALAVVGKSRGLICFATVFMGSCSPR